MKATDRFKHCPVCKEKFFNPYGMGIGRWNLMVCCSRKCRDEYFKGHPQYNTGRTHLKKGHKMGLGKKLSKEHRKKLSIAHMGQKPWNTGKYVRLSEKSEFKKGFTPWNKDTRGKGIMKANSASFKKGCIPWFKGKHIVSIQGEKHWNWQGGKTKINGAIRMTLEYKEWRRSVFKRDSHTCQICFKRGGDLHADHIKPFAYFPELRFDINNGRTLCPPCHRKTDTFGSNAHKYAKRVC